MSEFSGLQPTVPAPAWDAERSVPVSIIDPIKILDGFKNILSSCADEFVQLKISREMKMNEQEKKLSDIDKEIACREKKLEADIKALAEEEHRIYAEVKRQRIEQLRAVEKSKEEQLEQELLSRREKCIGELNRIKKTDKVITALFKCQLETDKKGVPTVDLSKVLDPIYDLPEGSFYSWYPECCHPDEITIAELSYYTGDINENIEKELVRAILDGVSNANKISYKFKYRNHLQKQIISNTYKLFSETFVMYFSTAFKQLTDEIRSCEEEYEKARAAYLKSVNQLDDNGTKLFVSSSATQMPAELTPKQQAERTAIEARKKERREQRVALVNEVNEEIAGQMAQMAMLLNEKLTVYFDGCLNGIRVGIPATGISVRDYVRLSPLFELHLNPETYKTPNDYRTFICMGGIRFDYAQNTAFSAHPQLIDTVNQFLREYFKDTAGPCFDIEGGGITIPYVIDFTFFRGICFDYTDSVDDGKIRENTERACYSLMFHMISDMRASSMKFTMLDTKNPTGFFSLFSKFMSSSERSTTVFNGTIYNTADAVTGALNELVNTIQTTGAKYGFNSIMDRNRDAQARKLPISVVFISDILNRSLLTKEACAYLGRVVPETRMGYGCVFVRDRGADMTDAALKDIGFSGTVLEYIDIDTFRVSKKPYIVDLVPMPDRGTVEKARFSISNCIETSEDDSIELRSVIGARSALEDAYEGILVDFMFNSDNSRVSLPINATFLNTLVLGDPNHGKTRLVHSLVANIMNKYSPKSVRINIMDFKGGSLAVSAYAQHRLPHLGIISSAPSRAAGLELLEYTLANLKSRAAAMNAINFDESDDALVDNLEAYIPYLREEGQKHDLEEYPREIIILDEVQVLFEKDDEIAARSRALIDKLFGEMRAFGFNFIMTTQWAPRLIKALGEDLIRNGFQNKLILYTRSREELGVLNIDINQMAAVHGRGQALYSRGESNDIVDIALISKDENAFIKEIENAYINSNIPVRTKLIRSEINEGVDSPFVRFLNVGGDSIDVPMILGETMLSEQKEFSLTPDKNGVYRFLMVSGTEARSSVMMTLLICLLTKAMINPEKKIRIMFADYGNNCKMAKNIISYLGEANDVMVYSDTFDSTNQIEQELKEYSKDSDGSELYLFVSDLRSAMMIDTGLEKLTNMLTTIRTNSDLNVSLFLFSKQYSDITKPFAGTDFMMRFERAIFEGTEAEFINTVGEYEKIKHLNGEALFCYDADHKLHRILPFVYEPIRIKGWLKRYFEKLAGIYESKKKKRGSNNEQ